MKKPRILTPEERAIWRESNRHTTPFERSIEEPTDEASLTPVISNSIRAATAKALPINAPASRPRAKAPLPALSQREANKRLKQHPKVDATLDLHGMTKLEAMEQVTRFITRQQQMGDRHVVIITGKGRGTAMGVLRAALPDWLNEPRLRPLISTISHARPEKGGEGVTHVLLKRP